MNIIIWSQAHFYGCGTWDVEGLAEAHDDLDGLEEGKEERSVFSRSLAWMSTTARRASTARRQTCMMGLRRERLSPWRLR